MQEALVDQSRSKPNLLLKPDYETDPFLVRLLTLDR